MMRPVDPTSYTPVHVQVSDDLRDRIRDGEYRPGTSLPSTADLAHAYQVGVATIRKALATLAAEHLIRTVRGVRAEIVEHQERAMVTLEPEDEVEFRPATAAERRKLGLAEGAYVADVTRADGTAQVFAALAVRFRVVGEQPPA
jgi:DNA-binding GntR family transcriptional regulator